MGNKKHNGHEKVVVPQVFDVPRIGEVMRLPSRTAPYQTVAGLKLTLNPLTRKYDVFLRFMGTNTFLEYTPKMHKSRQVRTRTRNGDPDENPAVNAMVASTARLVNGGLGLGALLVVEGKQDFVRVVDVKGTGAHDMRLEITFGVTGLTVDRGRFIRMLGEGKIQLAGETSIPPEFRHEAVEAVRPPTDSRTSVTGLQWREPAL